MDLIRFPKQEEKEALTPVTPQMMQRYTIAQTLAHRQKEHELELQKRDNQGAFEKAMALVNQRDQHLEEMKRKDIEVIREREEKKTLIAQHKAKEDSLRAQYSYEKQAAINVINNRVKELEMKLSTVQDQSEIRESLAWIKAEKERLLEQQRRLDAKEKQLDDYLDLAKKERRASGEHEDSLLKDIMEQDIYNHIGNNSEAPTDSSIIL